MARYILCPKCSDRLALHPEDKANGFKERRTMIDAKRPADLAVTTTVLGEAPVVTPVPVMLCDACNGEIPDGTQVICVTHWRGEEPGLWENEYEL